VEAPTQPITLEDLRIAIRFAPSSSVSGPSGLAYAMLKLWPEAVLIEAHMAVKPIWEDKFIPECSSKKWLCPKPKVGPDLATLQDQ